jgi:SAM-dependent methyltransferase
MNRIPDMNRIQREREFHDKLARKLMGGISLRRLTNRMAAGLDWEFLYKSIWAEVGDLHGKMVLDYGCGAGGLAIQLAKRGATAFGIDISENMLKLAVNLLKFGSQEDYYLLFSLQDCHRTAFPDQFFDYVFGFAILHHLELEIAYAELARILKPGGQAFFIEPLLGHPLLSFWRKITPSIRTFDEKPLNLREIELASRYFEVSHTEYFLLAPLAAPLSLIHPKLAKPLARILHNIDMIFFKHLPWTSRYAWITVIRLRLPT